MQYSLLSFLYLTTIALFCLIQSEELQWNYAQNGKDWPALFAHCKQGQQSPMKIVTEDSTELSFKEYFVPKMNKDVTGTLQLQNQKNHLVLNFTVNNNQMGTLMHSEGSNNLLVTNCSAITFHMPGEIIIDDQTYDMELKVNCSGFVKESKMISLFAVSIPVIKEATAKQSKFFDQLTLPADAKLPLKVTIKDFNDLMDPLMAFDTIYRYQAFANFPPCFQAEVFFVVKKALKINEQTYNTLYKLLDLTKNPKGTARICADRDVDDTDLEHYFISFK